VQLLVLEPLWQNIHTLLTYSKRCNYAAKRLKNQRITKIFMSFLWTFRSISVASVKQNEGFYNFIKQNQNYYRINKI